jgi:hypothetical protein
MILKGRPTRRDIAHLKLSHRHHTRRGRISQLLLTASASRGETSQARADQKTEVDH